MEHAPCKRTFQYRTEPGVLRTPQTSAQLFGIDQGPHNGGRPGGVGKAQSVEASIIVLMLFLLRQRNAVPLKSPATTSICRENHDSSDGENELLGDAFLLAVNVADM